MCVFADCFHFYCFFFFVNEKTAYDLLISDWSSDVCSSDLVLSERGSAIGVYRDTGSAPEFVQLLPTAIGPEGAVAIPGRNLLAVSNETDLIEDGGVRSHVTLYSYGEGPAQYPMVVSGSDHSGRPIGFGAQIGRAHVCTPVTNAHIVCRL